MKTKKIIVAIVVIYILHLVISNWSILKHAITGTYQSGFVFIDFKLLIMCLLIFFSLQIAQFTSKGKSER